MTMKVVRRAVAYVEIQMDDSPWSIRIAGGPGGKSQVTLHWNGKSSATHTAEVDNNELVAALEDL